MSSTRLDIKGLQIFQDETGGKTKAFVRLLEAKENTKAIQLLQKFKVYPFGFQQLLSLIYKASPEMLKFMIEALTAIKEPWILNAFIFFIEDINNTRGSHASDKTVNELIAFILPYCDDTKLKSLLKINDERNFPILIRKAIASFYSANANQQTNFLSLAIQQYDAILLKYFLDCETSKQRAAQFHEKILALKAEESAKSQFLLSLKDEDCWFVMKLMKQFCNGFGNITPEGGLLTIAQTHARKSYDYNPVLLNGMSEFEKYLEILKDCSLPLRERVILADSHWIAADINIDADGHVSIFFIDSFDLGYFHSGTKSAMILFHRAFPNATIYCADIKRLNSIKGCSVFELDDVRHLYTIENGHLEEKYRFSGLHGYIADSAKTINKSITITDEETKTKFQVAICALPLSLMRTMQTSRLLSEIKLRSEDERKVPVNKKGEVMTPDYAEYKFFKTSEDGRKFNTRLAETLNKMEKYNFEFLKTILTTQASKSSPAETKQESNSLADITHPYTLKGFEERMTLKKVAKVSAKGFSAST